MSTRDQFANRSDRFRVGEELRRAVLGSEYVDRAVMHDDALSEALNTFVTEHCWGNVWARDTIDRRTRSVVTLSVLAAMGRSHEIQTHVRGALRNGLAPEELAEIFLHVGVYAGVPAAVDAVRAARPILAEEPIG